MNIIDNTPARVRYPHKELQKGDVFRIRKDDTDWIYRVIVRASGDRVTVRSLKDFEDIMVLTSVTLGEINRFYFERDYEVELVTDFEIRINETEVMN